MKRIKEQQSSGREPEPASDAISSRTLGNAGRQDDHRGSRSWACRRLWPPSASPGVDASLLRASHLRTDHRSSQWHGRGDFEAAGGAFADGQTRDLPRRGCSCIESRPLRRLCHGRRYGGAPCRQERLHHANWFPPTSRRFAPVPPNRAGPSKSRLAFLSRLCGGVSLDVINAAALAYMEERNLPQIVIGKFKEHKARIFSSAGDWERHLQALGLSAMNVTPDPVLIASDGALWGAIHHQGLLPDTVIVSDDAGQFRVGARALCWIHAERLVHKLVPANDKQRNAVDIAKRMIWWFYRALKDYKLAPSVKQAQLLRARFDRIFKRASTGYTMLDRLLRRLLRNKEGLLRVLERPDLPINTNASENDIRAVVTKRKISGGTISDKGRDARDIMLGLAKTCMKLKLSFDEFIGARLGIPGPKIPPLASLIRPAPA